MQSAAAVPPITMPCAIKFPFRFRFVLLHKHAHVYTEREKEHIPILYTDINDVRKMMCDLS